MLISCGCAYWLIIYHALPYAQICRFQVNINQCHPFYYAMNTFDIPVSYNGTPIANMGCYSSFDIYFFLSWWNSLLVGCHDLLYIMMELPQGMSWLVVYHDGTPSGDVMIRNQVAIFPDTGRNSLWRRLLAAVPVWGHQIQWTVQITKENQMQINKPIQNQYKDFRDYVKHDLFISSNYSMDWCDIYDAVFRETLYFHYEQCKVK